MKARFVGKSSCGFMHGHSYCIYSRIDGQLIWIYDKNSRAQCPYESIDSFFANWKPYKVKMARRTCLKEAR